MKLTKKEAKRLSVIKWKFYSMLDYEECDRGHEGYQRALIKAHPELRGLHANCGFCEYIKKKYGGEIACEDVCLLGDCGPEYYEWTINPSRKTARAVLRKVQKVRV